MESYVNNEVSFLLNVLNISKGEIKKLFFVYKNLLVNYWRYYTFVFFLVFQLKLTNRNFYVIKLQF